MYQHIPMSTRPNNSNQSFHVKVTDRVDIHPDVSARYLLVIFENINTGQERRDTVDNLAQVTVRDAILKAINLKKIFGQKWCSNVLTKAVYTLVFKRRDKGV